MYQQTTSIPQFIYLIAGMLAGVEVFHVLSTTAITWDLTGTAGIAWFVIMAAAELYLFTTALSGVTNQFRYTATGFLVTLALGIHSLIYQNRVFAAIFFVLTGTIVMLALLDIIRRRPQR